MTPCSFKCDYQHLKEAHCLYLPTKRLYSPTRLHGIIRQMPITLTSYANFHPQCFDFYTHGEQENNDVEIRCSRLRPFVITHLNTTVSTFRDYPFEYNCFDLSWLAKTNWDEATWLEIRLSTLSCYCAGHAQLSKAPSLKKWRLGLSRLMYWASPCTISCILRPQKVFNAFY